MKTTHFQTPHSSWNPLNPGEFPADLVYAARHTIDVNPTTDLFHPDVPFKQLALIFATMQLLQTRTFLVQTVHLERAKDFIDWICNDRDGQEAWFRAVINLELPYDTGWSTDWPFRNIYIGTAIRTQEDIDTRIPLLKQVPASFRWLHIHPDVVPFQIADVVHPVSLVSGTITRRADTIPGINGIRMPRVHEGASPALCKIAEDCDHILIQRIWDSVG